MSSTCEDNITEEGAFSIENLLADFFLKKFNMPSSQSDKSDSNHYERRSKPKHKKHKKKSKHKHKKSKGHSIEKETSIYEKKDILDNSSSEEKDIKRLKKIKQLEGRSNKLWVPSSATDIASVSAVQDIPNSKSYSELNDDPIGIPYGPSIELLLTGIDSTHHENAKPVTEPDTVTVPVETVDSVIETKSRKAGISNDTSDIIVCDEIHEKSTHHSALLMSNAECEEKSMAPVKDDELCSKEPSGKNSGKTDLQEHCDQKVSRKKHSRHRSKSQNKHKSSTKDRLRSRSRSKTRENSKYESSSSRSRKYSVSYSESRVRRSSRSRSHSRGSKSSSRERKRNKTYSVERSRSNSCTRSKSRRSRSGSREFRKKRKHSESRISNKKQRLHSRSSEDEYLSKPDSSRSKEKKYQHRSPAHRHRSRSRSASSYEKHKSSKKSQESVDRTSDSRRKSRSKSREKNPSPEHKKIDQAKILEVARKKLQSMIEKGTLPEGLSLQNIKKEELASIKAGGKSVQELTDFCVKLSKKENEEDVADGAGTKDGEGAVEDDDDFIHHPFRLKEPSVLKLNIKNAVQIPIKTHAEKVAETARLSSQFPVSSGNQHKQKELEWVPVEPEKSKSNPKSNNSSQVTATLSAKEPVVQVSDPTVCEPTISEPAPANVDLPLVPVPTETSAAEISFATPTSVFQTAVSPVPLPSSSSNCSTQSVSPVFKPPKFLDITSIVTKRFKALTKLQEDPNDQAALNELQEAQTSIQEWVQSQQVPGQFTGSTDAKPLSVEELCGPKSFRFKKDIFAQAAPVTEGKGMSLLKKMGWNPGEGLGKNKEGSLEPLVLNIKTDKKGLVSEEDDPKKQTAMKELQGKHPVSALMELCSKRKWKPPLYTVVMDVGPPHKKLFLFKVEVNGVEYQPVNPCSNKKQAKAETAYLCLQALNVFSK